MSESHDNSSTETNPLPQQKSYLDQTVLQLPSPFFNTTIHTTDLAATVAEAQVDPASTQNKQYLEFNDIDKLDEFKQKTLLSKTFGPSLFTSLDAHLNQESSDQDLDTIEEELVRFKVRFKLGSGAFGNVFGAHDRDLNRNVALKQFKGEKTNALIACRNELRFVGRLEHPSIPPVYQASRTHDGTPYIVMKQVEGESLEHIITLLQNGDPQAHAKYTFRYRAQLITQLLRVVIQAHQSEVLHRDIKPENIKLGLQDELYLLDWGIAEDFAIAQANPIFCGTPLYMSPEQARGEALGPQSDIYSIGAVAYEFMTLCKSAPKAQTFEDFIASLQTHKPKPTFRIFHATQRYIPPEYNQAIMTAIEPSIEQRYASAQEMLSCFEAILNGDFDIVCSRTLIKKLTHLLNNWLSHSLKNTLILYVSIILFIIGLLALGGWLSRLV
ncbi:MAG: hypothetical protein CMH49_02200 [Myxococcales bacterium]|nr:hypothetical protein [Myxococcales bacterium]